jgi:NitT/TauT family transport system substrate-binding protein
MANDASARWPKASVVTAFCLLSCVALNAPYSPAAAADQVKVGIARTISDAGYYIADAMGFFREDGLDVSITAFNSAAQMIAPLGTGELDVGGGTVSAGFYNAVGRGIGMKIVADQASIKPGYGYSSLMVRKDHVVSGRYKTFADLKGMKVAIGAPGTGTASALNEALKKGGLKYGDVDVVYLGFPEHLPAYKNKGIDASITNEPTMTRAIEDGVAVRVAGNDVTYPDQQTAVTFFSDHFISSRRDAAERFMLISAACACTTMPSRPAGWPGRRRTKSLRSWSSIRPSRTKACSAAWCRAIAIPTARSTWRASGRISSFSASSG